MKFKSLVLAAGLLSAGLSSAATITCGNYVVEDAAVCRAYASTSPVTSTFGSASPFVNTTVGGGGGNQSILTYAGGTVAQIGNNSPLPQPPNAIVEAVNALNKYLILIFDTPPNQWAVIEVSGAALASINGGLDIGEASTRGNYKYGLYSLTPTTVNVPVPASLALLGVGLLGLAFGRKHSSKK